MKTLVIIPHYNHERTIAAVANQMQQFGLDILIVDDGSSEHCQPILQQLVSGSLNVIFRTNNGGKGAAIKTGIAYAQEQGYTHFLQVDADGQHQLNDTPKFLQAAMRQPEAVICGLPQYSEDAPKARLYGRKITDFWNMINTCSTDIKDGMCGFRLYPVASTHAIIQQEYIGERMDFDTEILVHLHWRDVPFIWIKTPVHYQANGISHFRTWQDNVLISKMHARLFFRMLKRLLTRFRLSEKEKNY